MVHLEDGSRKEELFAMWQRIFHDTRPYTEYYFDEVYGHNEVLLEENEEGLRGMLHLNPYELLAGEKNLTARYIVGVSTEEEFRRQGVMRSLLMETFERLRDRGEPFTYLMPADEAYYLPFSFQFGMTQIEQEIEAGTVMPIDAGYEFCRSDSVDLPLFVQIENEWKGRHYGLSTQVSVDYFKRLEKEVKSEFGCFFYAKKDGLPAGRFVVYAEDDFLAISQLSCFPSENRSEFMGQVIRFLDDRYHYKKYRITYPEDWTDSVTWKTLLPEGRVFHSKKNGVIMFRILRLEALSGLFAGQEDGQCTLYVTDPDIGTQEGSYLFTARKEGLSISRTDTPKDQADAIVSIADLTERLIGSQGDSMEVPPRFNEKASDFWKNFKAMAPIEIPEIV